MKVEFYIIGKDTIPPAEYAVTLEESPVPDWLSGTIEGRYIADHIEGVKPGRFVVHKDELKRVLMFLLGEIRDGNDKDNTVLRLILG